MCDEECRDQYARQDERILRSSPQQEQQSGDSDGRGDACCRRGVEERAKIVERRALIGHDLDGASDHQPTGCAEKAPDHRVGYETDRTSGMGEPEHTKEQSREPGRKRHGDEHRTKKIGRTAGHKLLHDRCDERGNNDRDRAVRSGNGKGQRAA